MSEITVKELYLQTINNGLKAAGMITEPDKKAIAYAEIAKALAMTGLIGGTTTMTTDVQSAAPAPAKEKAAAPAPAGGKAGLKPAANKAAAPAPAAPKEEPAPAPEPEIVEEWTEEMNALKADILAEFTQMIDDWALNNQADDQPEGVTWLDTFVSEFSEGTLSSADDITPMNIDAFVSFLKMKAAAAAEQ